MSNKRLTDFQRCHMEHMRNAGASYRTIAATLKLSKGTISYHLTPGPVSYTHLTLPTTPYV